MAYDLYCGLGGWSEGFLAEGYRCVGFDIQRHDYGNGSYPGELVLQDARTIHGAQLRDAAVIVASPPCQEFSYRAMPWKRAKSLPPPVDGINLFWQCWRIQQEACEAAGHYIPLVVENVKGAQPWVGRAAWHFGSFYLWGDVPALMPSTKQLKVGRNFHQFAKTGIPSASFHGAAHEASVQRAEALKVPTDGPGRRTDPGKGARFTSRDCGIEGVKVALSGRAWFAEGLGKVSSRCAARKAQSAQIAKIPPPLSRWIAQVYKPDTEPLQRMAAG